VGALATGLIARANGGLTGRTLVESFVVTARATAMIFFIVLGAAIYNGFLALTQVPQEMSTWVVAQGFAPLGVLAVILVFYLVMGCLMDSLSMILLTVPIFFPVVSVLDFGLVDLIAMQHEAARAALSTAADLAPEMRAAIEAALASGVEITREMQAALDIRVTEAMAERRAAELTAIWFGILVLIVVEVGLITPPVGMNLFVINAMDRTTPMLRTYRAVLYFVGSDMVRVAILMAFPAITLFLV
jgi:TRAP-type C4-dicarboxylate transport system permease large subunit